MINFLVNVASQMHIYLVKTKEEWDKYFPVLRDSARTGTVPELFLVGLDTEFISRANFEVSFQESKNWILDGSNDVATCILQFASRTCCLIVYLTKIGPELPKSLIGMLISESWVKVGVGVELDLKYLSVNYRLGHCAGGIELRNFAIMSGMERSNLEHLYSVLTGHHVKKQKSIHDWTKELTREQLEYCAKDAIMSREIFEKMFEPTLKFLSGKNYQDGFKLDFQNLELESPEINYIGRLNEKAQEKKLEAPQYIDQDKIGAEFQVRCVFMEKETVGNGRSKKDAKQEASRLMLDLYLL